MSDEYNYNSENNKRSVESCCDSVKALRNGKSCHTYCEQTDITHYVTKAADRIQEYGKRICKTSFQSLCKCTIR